MKKPNKTPRAAYCTGCGVTFEKRHLLMNHRNTEKCGGRFLPEGEREFLLGLRSLHEALLRQDRMFAALEKL